MSVSDKPMFYNDIDLQSLAYSDPHHAKDSTSTDIEDRVKRAIEGARQVAQYLGGSADTRFKPLGYRFSKKAGDRNDLSRVKIGTPPKASRASKKNVPRDEEERRLIVKEFIKIGELKNDNPKRLIDCYPSYWQVEQAIQARMQSLFLHVNELPCNRNNSNQGFNIACYSSNGVEDLKFISLHAPYVEGATHLKKRVKSMKEEEIRFLEASYDDSDAKLAVISKKHIIYLGEIENITPDFFLNCYELLATNGMIIFMELFSKEKTSEYNKNTGQQNGVINADEDDWDLYHDAVKGNSGIPNEDIPLLMQRILQLQKDGFELTTSCISQCGSLYVFSAIKYNDD